MADEALKFESEAAKAEAIANYDTKTGTEEGIDALMNAPVVVPEKTEAEAEVKPPQSEEEETPEAPAEEPVVEENKEFDWNAWANNLGYKSPAEARKALDEAKKTVERQQAFINEKLNTKPAVIQAPVVEAPVIQRQESKIEDIKQTISSVLEKRRGLINRLREEPSLNMDPDFLASQAAVEEEKYALDLKMAEELNSLRSMHEATNQQLASFTKAKEEELLREQSARMHQMELDEIQKFALNPAHAEFAFSAGKDADAVEAEYISWVNKVATALYGHPVNIMRTVEEREAVASAMERLSQKDPEVLNACQVVGVPTEPSDDLRKYLDICELLDHRDGIKKDPITGQKMQQTRTVFDAAAGKFKKEPVRFASLEDAYNHKLAVDGTFNKRIKEAYSKGGKDVLSAVAKKAKGPVQLGNASGVNQKDVGLAMTAQDALKFIEGFNETEAMKRKMAGDSSLMDEYEKAMSALMPKK